MSEERAHVPQRTYGIPIIVIFLIGCIAGCIDFQEPGDAICAVEPTLIQFGDVPLGAQIDTFVEVTEPSEGGYIIVAVDRSFTCPGVTYDTRYDTLSRSNDTATFAISYAPTEAASMACVMPIVTVHGGGLDCPSVGLYAEAYAPATAWSECSTAAVQTDLHGVSGVSADEVYAAGDGGQVLKHTGDCQWQGLQTGADTVDLTDIWAYAYGTDNAERSLWAVGNVPPPPGLAQPAGTILASAGGAWTVESYDFRYVYGAVWGSSECDVYFVGMGVSTDFPNAQHYDCQAFTPFQIDWGMSELSGISGTASDDIWAVLRQQSYNLYHYDGATWTLATAAFMNQPLHDVWATASGQVYVVGEQGAIYHYDGTQWTDESVAGESRTFYGVWAAETGEVFVVGAGGAIYMYDGSAWASQSGPAAGDLYDVWGTSATNVFAVGSNGTILRYEPEYLP